MLNPRIEQVLASKIMTYYTEYCLWFKIIKLSSTCVSKPLCSLPVLGVIIHVCS